MIKDLQAGDPASVGPYRLLGRLGAGGMGQVFLAKSPGGRLLAIKLIRPELAAERGFRARFSGEISAARNVSGIYTAAVVDADADAEHPWMATVYVPGPSLTDAVEETGALPAASVIALAGGLAEALGAIHRAGLIHRDLKPSNVLLATDGPRVIDFGISRLLERSNLTTTGMVLGSPGFMSPEQARGDQVGPPTDVFSLGAVLAYAATADSPFGRGPTPALLYRVVNEEPDLTLVDAGLRPLIERCLAKDPADRPTPAELVALLSEDVGVLTGDWLPEAVTGTMAAYTPTLQTPLPPPPRSAPQTPLPPSNPDPARPSGERAPVPEVPLIVPEVPLVAATSVTPSVPENPAATMAVAYGAPGRPTAGMPTPPPDSGSLRALQQPASGGGGRLRRWRWPVAALAAAAAVVAVVAVMLTAHASGGSKNGGTPTPNASLAGLNTSQPASPTPSGRTSTTAAATARASTAKATPSQAQATSAYVPTASSAPTASNSPAPKPTPAPTTAAPTTPAPTTSSPPTSAPTTPPPTTSAPPPTTTSPTTPAPTAS